MSKLSVENHHHIAVITVRFDGMDKGELAWLATGEKKLGLVFDRSELDIDLSQLTYAIAYMGRRWRVDAFNPSSLPAANSAGYPQSAWIFEILNDIVWSIPFFSLARLDAKFWYHFRFVLSDGRAFEFLIATGERPVIAEISRLERKTKWRRRFKRWFGKSHG